MSLIVICPIVPLIIQRFDYETKITKRLGFVKCIIPHPNYHFRTYSFLLEPVIQIRTLEDIFQEPKAAFAIVQSHIREELYKVRISAEPEAEPWELEREWVDSGTEKWEDLNSFVFRNKGIEILFAPYSVAAYALGAQAAEIPYEKIRSLMRNEYVSALGIPHLTY